MSAHVICLTSGGVPIFTRSKGKTENLPFSIVGSLNGVHMFSKSQKVELLSTETKDYKVVWKEFHDSITLIGISSGCTTSVLTQLLESVFNVIVLIVGLDEVRLQKNIERLKRELRVGYPIMDRLLHCLDIGETGNKFSSDLVRLVEVILCPENHLIEIVLDSYSECVDSMFSCVLIHGKIAAATEQWWSMHPDEMKLLSLLATADNAKTPIDIPVFLPHRCPNVAFRFIVISLMQDIQVCCLCGPTPVLDDIQHAAVQCFKNSIEFLGSALQCHTKNFPLSMHVDPGILGLLLINFKVGKYMLSQNPQHAANKKTASGSHRLDILRTFYYQAVLSFLIPDLPDDISKAENNKEASPDTTTGKETYWCSEYHKCHAARADDNILCVLYNSSVPTHAMRFITMRTIKALTTDKQMCW